MVCLAFWKLRLLPCLLTPLLNIFVCLKCCILPDTSDGARKACLSPYASRGSFGLWPAEVISRQGGVATSERRTCDPLGCSDCLKNALGGPFLSLPKTTKLLTEDARGFCVGPHSTLRPKCARVFPFFDCVFKLKCSFCQKLGSLLSQGSAYADSLLSQVEPCSSVRLTARFTPHIGKGKAFKAKCSSNYKND